MAGLVVALHAVQLGRESFGRPGFGTDFQLLYAVAVAWGQGRDAYDDAVIKETWQARGDSTLPTPGRPVTPNVYPLTIAPLIRPFTLLPFRAALLAWTGVVLLAEGWLVLLMLRAAGGLTGGQAGDGEADKPRVRLVPLTLAVALFVLSYPLRLNLASLNIGIVTAALALAALPARRSVWLSGLCMGLALVKYSTTGPLLLLMAWRRQYRTVVVALAVQAGLLLTATWGGGYRSPLTWITAMRAEISASLEPGAINAPDAVKGAAMHLELRSLWHRFLPGADRWHWLPIVVLLAVALVALRKAPRCPPPSNAPDLHAALMLVACATAFYHRAYDLIPVIALTLAWLVRPRTGSYPYSRPVEALMWAALALTVLPGLWSGWDSAAASPLTLWFVQPACAWATLFLVPLLALPMAPSRSPVLAV